MSRSLAQSVGSMVRGDHACLSYASDDEREGALLPFVHAGLRAREKVVCVAADGDAARLADRIARGGTDVSGAFASGQLVLRGAAETYLDGGTFDSDRMMEHLRAEVATAHAEGFGGFRMAGEMEWALSSHTSPELLREYELRVDAVLREAGITALCQYDRRRFDREVLRQVEHNHPLMLGGWYGDASSMAQLRVERSPHRELLVRGEVDFTSSGSLRCSLEAEAARREAVRLDLRELGFIDGAGLRAILAVARRVEAQGGRLVLVAPRPFVIGLIALLGISRELRIEALAD